MNTFSSPRNRSVEPQTRSALPRRARRGILVQARFWTVMVAVFALAGCSLYYDFFYPWGKDPLKWTEPAHFGPNIKKVVKIEQGWTPEIMRRFWHTSQGSRFLRYEMFMALEQKDDKKLFSDSANIAKYRYIPQKPDPIKNPDGLPIGFALDKGANRNFVGLTCAACHTTVITYKDKAMLIEGAPAMANFQWFFQDLSAALDDTLANDAKRVRFIAKVADLTGEEPEHLELRLKHWAKVRRDREKMNHTEVPYGYARVDAFGQIYNAATAVNLKSEPGGDYGMPDNAASPDAPVSYPFLWGTPQSDVVQWNGIANNVQLGGPLGRNAGEVIGVFGEIEVKRSSTYKSSVQIVNLALLERWVRQLRPPPWPAHILGKIDPVKRAAGEALFRKHCKGCHMMLEDPADEYCAVLTPLDKIGTDPTMAVNSVKTADTGFLEGRPESVRFGKDLPATTLKAIILKNEVTGALLHQWQETVEAIAIERTKLQSREELEHSLAGVFHKGRKVTCKKLGKKFKFQVYKARPLDGIWATAPFLHNGSVPTLWHVLNPKERPDTFKLGGREYDPTRVGYVNEGDFTFETSLPGNSNEGHDYADDANLSPDERWQLVEYLKSI